MKTLPILLALSASFGLAGCGSHTDSATHGAGDGHDHAAEAAPAVLFKAGRGLQLGATAAQFIGLATAEVVARDLPGVAGAPAVPESALLRTVRGEFVFVANGGWYLRTPVQTGAAAGGWVEIRDGLYEGDTVVAQGARALWLAEIQAVNGGVSCTHGH
jgi:multidrug efflux pump subunit AcrA (membrane-fusion protein)